MHSPNPGDYIDIHIHGGKPSAGIFMLESLMAHEDGLPADQPGIAYTYGIHPWFLNEDNYDQQIERVEKFFKLPAVIAIGEAGFDKLKGARPGLQLAAFERQVILSEKAAKPMVVHCVKAWDELLSVQKKVRPEMPWMVHGFRGSKNLANQLISKGMYLSVWFDFAIRPESADLLRSLPHDRFFLETDGADVDIREIYAKVAGDIGISADELKSTIFRNFNQFFKI